MDLLKRLKARIRGTSKNKAEKPMHYYEIWFYYYGENDPRTDLDKEFTFYCIVDKEITSTKEMKAHLRKEFPNSGYDWDVELDHLSNFFELTADEFEYSLS